jgi:diaminopimelate decarboxylase
MSTKSTELFYYQQDSLCFNGHALSDHVSIKNYQQPVLMHDLQLVQERINWVKEWKGLGQLHFALKSNYDEIILKLIQKNGCGVDVVSLGEIQLALRCGFKPQDILFSGVAKTEKEIRWAIENEIYQINVESLSELKRIQRISNELEKSVNIGLRINPEVDAQTHPNIATALLDSKFGLNAQDLPEVEGLIKDSKYIILKSMSFHIGSQVLDTSIYREAILKMKPLYLDMKSRHATLDRFDLGGGLGLNYRDHNMTHDYERWVSLREIYEEDLSDIKDHFMLEIGRFIVARSAVLVAQVQYIKKTSNKKILIIDMGMNNLIRPMLYQAYHHIYPLKQRAGKQSYMVVGPLCESSDVFHDHIELNTLHEGDFVAISDAGAYTKSMSSNYNLQPIAIDIYL